MFIPGTFCLAGRIFSSQRLADGIHSIVTNESVGYALERHVNERLPDLVRDDGGFYMREMANIVEVLFPQFFTAQTHNAALAWAKRRWPEAYMAITGKELSPGESAIHDFTRFAAAHPAALVAVGASLGGNIPPGMVRVMAGRASQEAAFATLGQRTSIPAQEARFFLVPEEEYAARPKMGFVIDETRHQEIPAFVEDAEPAQDEAPPIGSGETLLEDHEGLGADFPGDDVPPPSLVNLSYAEVDGEVDRIAAALGLSDSTKESQDLLEGIMSLIEKQEGEFQAKKSKEASPALVEVTGYKQAIMAELERRYGFGMVRFHLASLVPCLQYYAVGIGDAPQKVSYEEHLERARREIFGLAPYLHHVITHIRNDYEVAFAQAAIENSVPLVLVLRTSDRLRWDEAKYLIWEKAKVGEIISDSKAPSLESLVVANPGRWLDGAERGYLAYFADADPIEELAEIDGSYFTGIFDKKLERLLDVLNDKMDASRDGDNKYHEISPAPVELK